MVGIEKEQIDMVDMNARRILGLAPNTILDYNQVVNHYIFMLNYWAILLDEKRFLDLGNFEVLNYSFNFCTGFILEDYINFYVNINDMKEKNESNPHYRGITDAAGKILARYTKYGLEQVGDIVHNSLYQIAEAVYKYENDNTKVKMYS